MMLESQRQVSRPEYLQGSGASALADGILNFIAVDDERIDDDTPLVKVISEYVDVSGAISANKTQAGIFTTGSVTGGFQLSAHHFLAEDHDELTTGPTNLGRVSAVTSELAIPTLIDGQYKSYENFRAKGPTIELPFPGSANVDYSAFAVDPGIFTLLSGTLTVRGVDLPIHQFAQGGGTCNYQAFYHPPQSVSRLGGSFLGKFLFDESGFDSTLAGDFNFAADNKGTTFGAGEDVGILFTGTNWDFDCLNNQPAAIRFNPAQRNTDFQVFGNNRQLLQLDANGAISWFRPNDDSTTAFALQDVAGNSDVVYDSTNGRLGVGTTPAYKMDVNGECNVPGTTGNSYRWNAATTAPGLTATPVFTSYYGGNTNALGDPVAWVLVNVAGTERKIPCYAV